MRSFTHPAEPQGTQSAHDHDGRSSNYADTAHPSALEEKARPGTVKRTILVTDQVRLLKMTTALDYLFAYRHICTEQRVSQSFPAVALRQLYDAYRIPGPREKTDEMVQYTMDYLAQTLSSNGLYSYWPGADTSVSLTAYVVEFLVEAQKAGYKFDPELLDRPIQALTEALRSDYAYFLDGWAFTERTESLYALSKAGQFDISYGTELAKKSRYLDLFGVSRVLEAFHAGGAGEKRIQDALTLEINEGFIFKLRDGSEVFGGLEDRWKSWDGPVLASEIKTQAAMIRALYPEMKGDRHLEMVVDDLVKKGGRDGWGNTQTNAQALLALKDVMLEPKARTKTQPFRLTVGGTETMLGIGPDAPTAFFATGKSGDGKLTMVGGDAEENFSARLGLSYLPVSTGEWVKPRNEGFVVDLEFIRIQQGGAPAKRERIETEGKKYTFGMGEILEEHVQVINPEDRNYVAVTVPIAAGMEPMNPNLATSPKEARPDGSLTRSPTYAMYLDDEVRFYYENLPKGTYDFYFRVRAMTAGDFVQPAAHAERMYRPADRGNSPGARIVILPRE